MKTIILMFINPFLKKKFSKEEEEKTIKKNFNDHTISLIDDLTKKIFSLENQIKILNKELEELKKMKTNN